MKKKIEKAPAWAFEISGELCRWSEPHKVLLNRGGDFDPSIYKPVQVYIVRKKDFPNKRKRASK